MNYTKLDGVEKTLIHFKKYLNINKNKMIEFFDFLKVLVELPRKKNLFIIESINSKPDYNEIVFLIPEVEFKKVNLFFQYDFEEDEEDESKNEAEEKLDEYKKIFKSAKIPTTNIKYFAKFYEDVESFALSLFNLEDPPKEKEIEKIYKFYNAHEYSLLKKNVIEYCEAIKEKLVELEEERQEILEEEKKKRKRARELKAGKKSPAKNRKKRA